MLTGYVQYLQGFDPRYHSYEHQLAHWLNLHNATVVILVLESGATQLDDLGSNYAHRRDPVIEVASVELSLDDIVEGILLPIWQQPEVHFLVACAAMHCPAAPAEALHAGNVHHELQQAPIKFSQRPGAIQFNEDGVLTLSATDGEYADSLGDSDELLRRVAFMADDRVALRLLGHQGEVEFRENTRIVAP